VDYLPTICTPAPPPHGWQACRIHFRSQYCVEAACRRGIDICHRRGIRNDFTVAAEAGERRHSIFKLQEAAAVYIPEVNTKTIAALEKYADTIYLTQTIEKRMAVREYSTWKMRSPRSSEPGPRNGGRISTCRCSSRSWRVPHTRFAIEDALRYQANPCLCNWRSKRIRGMCCGSLKTGDIVTMSPGNRMGQDSGVGPLQFVFGAQCPTALARIGAVRPSRVSGGSLLAPA